ncbi:hypothetical protein H7347_00020 [Corynebacterium sp. zg-331]|uniref:hypothetical protein n=1 Tax=unclassified Corynebacterium TaxID=2624378 RepID=UPI00128DC3F0|nr:MULTISPECIES: hypothetical protein [unclassified Corynebacterium]MBC3184986.1 hypothetical protein [Corynebacterium sp. zg-331]MPV51488.1 hypothetical protein [Corynebacterium sp. zg331]
MLHPATPHPDSPPASMIAQRRYLLSARVSLGLAVTAVPLLFISLIPSMILWAIGLSGYIGCVHALERATGRQSNTRLDDLDEYEQERVLRTKTRAMNLLRDGLLAVMTALLIMPTFITTLEPSPEETATWVRAVGMAAGIIALPAATAVLKDIATGMNRDETLLDAH